MPPAFLPSPALPRRRAHARARRACCASPPRASANGRSPWPFPRFVQTLLRYSPLARLARPPTSGPAAMLRERRATAASSSASGRRRVVLVTGANGGAGRRVVRDLLAAPAPRVVRALVRSKDKLRDALRDVGVSLEDEVQAGALEVVVADLYNVRLEFMRDVEAVVSCTGVNVGPTDDPDRSKYFEGLTFYEPTVLDDTPENVEYVGVKNLVQAAVEGDGGEESQKDEEKVVIMGFADEAVVKDQWGALDDVVMGGVSKSGVKVRDGNLAFEGVVSTDNRGGFTSVRTVQFDEPLNLADFDGLYMRVCGDGQSYKLIVRDDGKWDGISHCFTFPTTKGKWTEVRVPFSNFKPVFRAKTLPDDKQLDPSQVQAFQVMLSKFEYDGDLNPNFKPGPFSLQIDSICAYKRAASESTAASESRPPPRMVHVGSAGVTRVLRLNEFDVEKQPPAVRMNEMLGQILNWKFAGEDVIRQSGLPYTILRPCALTLKDPVGLEALVFDQGDTMTGQMSRDDLAALIVRALEDEAFVNVTVEVAMKKEGEDKLQPLESRLQALQKDSVDARGFASFPYVPAAVAK